MSFTPPPVKSPSLPILCSIVGYPQRTELLIASEEFTRQTKTKRGGPLDICMFTLVYFVFFCFVF